MFRRKRSYEVVYRVFATFSTIVIAKDKDQALKKFYRQAKRNWFITPDILSIQEIVEDDYE